MTRFPLEGHQQLHFLRRAHFTVKSAFAENLEFILQPDFGNNNDPFKYAARVAPTTRSRGSEKLAVGPNGYTSKDTAYFAGRRTA